MPLLPRRGPARPNLRPNGRRTRPLPDSVLAPATPAWLPAGAVVFADFVSGHYWIDGGEVAYASLFSDSAEAPAWRTSNGLESWLLEDHRELAASVTEHLGAAFTLVLDVTAVSDNDMLNLYADGASKLLKFSRYTEQANFYVNTSFQVDLYAGPWNSNAIRRAALTLNANVMALSLNGSAATSGTVTGDAVSVNRMAFVDMPEVQGFTVRRIAIYPARPNADLPALSAL